MEKIIHTISSAAAKARLAGLRAKGKAYSVIAQNNGEGFVDSALKILISVVIGALLLAGLYVLFKDTLLPKLTQRVIELFDYNG